MYLLSRDRLLDSLNPKPWTGQLQIVDADEANLEHTYYYFRLGRAHRRRNPDTNDWGPWETLENRGELRLRSSELVRVQSHEQFGLRERVMGTLGSTSTLAERGIHLLHGPTIDPLYPPESDEEYGKRPAAPLHLGIFNCFWDDVVLRHGDTLGKVMFFEVSDTHPVTVDKNSTFAHVVRERAPDDK